MNNRMHTESALRPGSASSGTAPAARALRGAGGYRGAELAADLLKRLFRRLPAGIQLRLWNGTSVTAGQNAAAGQESPFTLVFRNPEAVWSAVLGRDPLALAEAYFRGDLDIEGDFFAALSLKDHLETLQLPLSEKLGAALTALRLQVSNAAAHPAAFAPSHGPSIKAHSK